MAQTPPSRRCWRSRGDLLHCRRAPNQPRSRHAYCTTPTINCPPKSLKIATTTLMPYAFSVCRLPADLAEKLISNGVVDLASLVLSLSRGDVHEELKKAGTAPRGKGVATPFCISTRF